MSNQRPVGIVNPIPRTGPDQVGSIPQQRRKFRPRAPLLPYLHEKYPQKELMSRPFHFVNEILLLIKNIISSEGLYDENNPSVVLCNIPLEKALLVRALHLTEVREKVCQQLVVADSDLLLTPLPEPTALPLHPILRQRSPPSGRPIGIRERPESQVFGNRAIQLNERFKVKNCFLEVLRSLPTVNGNQEVFVYEELSRLLSQYILSRKQHFFDNRNIKIVVCDGDPLGTAFKVRAFHRSQVMVLLRGQLIPLTEEELRDLGPPPLPLNEQRRQMALQEMDAIDEEEEEEIGSTRNMGQFSSGYHSMPASGEGQP